MSFGEARLWSTFQGGQGKWNGYLDDYAFLAMAALDLSRGAQGSEECEKYLQHCQSWMVAILKNFKDPSGLGFFFTSQDHESLIQRPKSLFDQAIPSGSAVAWTCLAALVELGRDQSPGIFAQEVENSVRALFTLAEKAPYGLGEALCLSLLVAQGPVTVSGPSASQWIVHPHVFQKPTLEKGASSSYLVCHRNTCSLPLGSSEVVVVMKEKLWLR